MRSPIDTKHCYLHGWLEGQLLGFCIPVFPLIPQVHLMENPDFEGLMRRYRIEFDDMLREMRQQFLHEELPVLSRVDQLMSRVESAIEFEEPCGPADEPCDEPCPEPTAVPPWRMPPIAKAMPAQPVPARASTTWEAMPIAKAMPAHPPFDPEPEPRPHLPFDPPPHLSAPAPQRPHQPFHPPPAQLPAYPPSYPPPADETPPPPPPPPPPPADAAADAANRRQRRRLTPWPCAFSDCTMRRESERCWYCIGHCDDLRCPVHWDRPGRCQAPHVLCPRPYPVDCIMDRCGIHCTAMDCKRHRDPPDRLKSTNKKRGVRASMIWKRISGYGKR